MFQSMLSSTAWTTVPGITRTMIAASEVPNACFSGMPSTPARGAAP